MARILLTVEPSPRTMAHFGKHRESELKPTLQEKDHLLKIKDSTGIIHEYVFLSRTQD